jgi:hypothetical protein
MLDLSGRQRGNRVPWRKRKGIVAHSTTGRDLSGPRFRWSETLTRLRLHNALVSACDGADLADGFVAVLAGWMVTEQPPKRRGDARSCLAHLARHIAVFEKTERRLVAGRHSCRPAAAFRQVGIYQGAIEGKDRTRGLTHRCRKWT